jgi:type IV pilus assembly protein PilV
MIEVLVTLIILMVGLLGLLGMQVRSQQAELETYQRAQALVLLQDMVDRINGNRIAAKNKSYVTTSALGGGGALADCATLSGVALDQCEWGNLLRGAAEVTVGGNCTTTSGTDCAGAMLGARGCVVYDAASEIVDGTGATVPGTGIQMVTVAWQGVGKSFTPNDANLCGRGLYPDPSMRRLVTATLRVGALRAP